MQSSFADLPVSIERGGFIGVALGAIAGLQLALAALNAIWAGQYWRGLRTEKLLLQFHDELMQSRGSFQQVAGPNG